MTKNLKYVIDDDVLPDGTVLPKGAGVVYSSYVMGRMKDIWGEDVHDFRPDRWLQTEEDGTRVFRDHDQYAFPHFNAGLRICLGKYMAIMEAEIIICQVLRRFKCTLAMKKEDLGYTDSLTLSMKNGLMMNIQPLNEQGQS